MKAYLDVLRDILSNGERRTNRTGIPTISKFGVTINIDLQEGFPLLTTKKVYFKGIAGELIWMLSGSSNIKFLQERNIHIWDEWADKNGELGPVYGKQWRDWDGIDQIKVILEQLHSDRFSRRIILSSWNVSELSQMALPPCHILAQFYVHNDGVLDCAVYQRSGDMFLGIPFDIASYALLLHLMCRWTGYNPGKLYYTIGDAHIYTNHIEQVQEQLTRVPRKLPELIITGNNSLDALELENITLNGYNPYPAIKGEVAI